MASFRGITASNFWDRMSKDKEIAVDIQNVTKTFGAFTALNGVSLDIRDNEFFTLLGPSGCGKTTLLRLIAGFEEVTNGAIHLYGQNIADLLPNERPINTVFQQYALFPHMSVLENVSYGLNFSGFKKPEALERASAGLELVGLSGYGDRLPSELSGGQQQRVAVARALVLEPQVLLFDEPLSNLDAKLRRQVREEIREIQQNLGLTVIYVTHDQEEALAVSDEIVVMRNAAIAQIGSPRQLYDAPANHFVADFIGEANLIPCEVLDVSNEMAKIDVRGFVHKLPANGNSAGPATLAVRPSRLDIKAKAGIKATVRKATYVGNRMEYSLNIGGLDIFAVHDDVNNPLSIDEEIQLGLFETGPVLLPAL